MNYKIKGAIKKNRSKFVICVVLWLVLVIVLVAPVAYSFSYVQKMGGGLEKLIETFVNSVMNPFSTIGNIFTQGATQNFTSLLIGFTLVYAVLFFIGFFKSAPKNEYTDIEHGSSDWSQRGEQYRILSRNTGIILAEDNYLPLDKRGNVNVLVVGRFWFR